MGRRWWWLLGQSRGGLGGRVGGWPVDADGYPHPQPDPEPEPNVHVSESFKKQK